MRLMAAATAILHRSRDMTGLGSQGIGSMLQREGLGSPVGIKRKNRTTAGSPVNCSKSRAKFLQSGLHRAGVSLAVSHRLAELPLVTERRSTRTFSNKGCIC